ncbi:MAG: ComEA family DNA-binding protein [Candidatus Nanopelagicales bacterium]|nr:ComEA family DNA-binding protein [Candidatus Nanopelagicales bacterium]
MSEPFHADFDPPSLIERARILWEFRAARLAVAVMAGVVGLVAFLVWRGQPTEVAVAPSVAVAGNPLPDATGVGSGLATPLVSGSPTAEPTVVIVDVVGRVRRPGIVRLPTGSRVSDAIAAAGGLARGRTSINLARTLEDGEQIDVSAKPGADSTGPGSAAGSSGGAGSSTAKVDINRASSTELEVLPRIGPVTAQKIIDYRESNGGFRSVDQLREVPGIGEVTFAGLAPLVRV